MSKYVLKRIDYAKITDFLEKIIMIPAGVGISIDFMNFQYICIVRRTTIEHTLINYLNQEELSKLSKLESESPLEGFLNFRISWNKEERSLARRRINHKTVKKYSYSMFEESMKRIINTKYFKEEYKEKKGTLKEYVEPEDDFEPKEEEILAIPYVIISFLLKCLKEEGLLLEEEFYPPKENLYVIPPMYTKNKRRNYEN